MEHIHDIEKAVSNLTQNDLVHFRAWFEEFDAMEWDRQFEDDALNGRFDAMAKKALKDFRKGNCLEL